MDNIKKILVPLATMIVGVIGCVYQFSQDVHADEEMKKMIAAEVEKQLNNNQEEES